MNHEIEKMKQLVSGLEPFHNDEVEKRMQHDFAKLGIDIADVTLNGHDDVDSKFVGKSNSAYLAINLKEALQKQPEQSLLMKKSWNVLFDCLILDQTNSKMLQNSIISKMLLKRLFECNNKETILQMLLTLAGENHLENDMVSQKGVLPTQQESSIPKKHVLELIIK